MGLTTNLADMTERADVSKARSLEEELKCCLLMVGGTGQWLPPSPGPEVTAHGVFSSPFGGAAATHGQKDSVAWVLASGSVALQSQWWLLWQRGSPSRWNVQQPPTTPKLEETLHPMLVPQIWLSAPSCISCSLYFRFLLRIWNTFTDTLDFSFILS